MLYRVALLLASVVFACCAIVGPSADDLRNDPHGHLIWAVRRGDVTAIRTLAASGIDLNESRDTKTTFVFPDLDHVGWPALKHAVQKHHADAVRVLLDWGADPDAREPRSTATALFIAASYNDRAMVKWLLDAGADVNLVAVTAQAEHGGPLWHLIERVQGVQSPEAALELVRDTAAQSRP